MAFCSKCGTPIPDNASFCTKCGTPVGDGQISPVMAMPVSQEEKIVSAVGYLGFLFFVPLIAKPNSSFAKFHANQGFTLFLCEVILGLAGRAIGWLLGLVGGIVPILGIVLGLVIALISLGISVVSLVLTIMGIVNAMKAREKALPIIGQYTFLK